jgi:Fe-Mn family superoxide dismutase
MSKETLEYHHDKHHKAYVDTGNKLACRGRHGDLRSRSRQAVLRQEPDALQQCRPALQPHPLLELDEEGRRRQQAAGRAAEGVDSDLGGYDKFKADFIAAGTTQFGSGWAWLSVKDGKLAISKTPNGENPLVHGADPILGVDVWEHSYYIDYRNARPKYLEAFVDNLINWDYVLELYEAATK